MESPGKDSQPAPTNESFPKSMRLRSRLDFDDLFKSGLVVADNVLVIHARQAKTLGKLGISISKRVGNAPLRNRWKRLIREAFRRLAARKPDVRRIDLVIRPRRGAVPSFVAIQRSLTISSSRLIDQIGRRSARKATEEQP